MAVQMRETEHRSLGDLLKELRDETIALFRQEIALAKQELTEKASLSARNAAYLAGGALITWTGAIFLLGALSMLLTVALAAAGLSMLHAQWLAPLIVGAIICAIGAGLAMKAIKTFKEMSLKPERTIQSLKEDKQWVQQKLR